MLKILKSTPYTFRGQGVLLYLVEDSDYSLPACDKCIFRDYPSIDEYGVQCMEIHCCGMPQNTYFLIGGLWF